MLEYAQRFFLFVTHTHILLQGKCVIWCAVVQAIDPRTRMVLFKMLNRGVFNDINGCISTGKEVVKGIIGFILFVPVLFCVFV